MFYDICCVQVKMAMEENADNYVVLQSGHNIEKVREKMRELTKQIVTICSASKSFPYILEGLRSKNNRTRIECVDLVGFIIDHHGAEVKLEVFGLFVTSVVDALLLL
jgi:cytoskeleton-associated protein 5